MFCLLDEGNMTADGGQHLGNDQLAAVFVGLNGSKGILEGCQRVTAGGADRLGEILSGI